LLFVGGLAGLDGLEFALYLAEVVGERLEELLSDLGEELFLLGVLGRALLRQSLGHLL
jgi:hypothetical protein